jgi:hypothetical protein
MLLDQKQLSLIQEWNVAKQQLNQWSETESTLRDLVIQELFNTGKTEGTETIELSNDWTIKATKKLNYRLSNKDGELVNIIATLPSVIAQNLIRWQPDLNLSMYRKLDPSTQALFNPVLTIKPSKPSLELIAPDSK